MDPTVFSPGAVSEETVRFNARLEEIIAQYPPTAGADPVSVRLARESGESFFGPLTLSERAVTGSIPGPTGPIATRMFLPERPRAVYLHIHGGGWVVGAPHHQDPRLEALSDRCEVAVVSIDYRLAPEHAYPEGPDDCEAAALWLAAHMADEFGTERLIVGGESAGAHLAVVTMLRMRDRHGFDGFAAANLVYGVYDLRLTPSARRWGDRNLVLNTPTMRWFTDHFVPPGLRDDPDVSPIMADLSRLAPALFTVGTADPLLDDTLFMYQRWVAAGNRAGLAVYPGGAHGFDAFPIEIGQGALQAMYRFVDAVLRTADQPSGSSDSSS